MLVIKLPHIRHLAMVAYFPTLWSWIVRYKMEPWYIMAKDHAPWLTTSTAVLMADYIAVFVALLVVLVSSNYERQK